MSQLQRPDYYAENTALPDRRASEPPLGREARVQSVVVNKRSDVLWNSFQKEFLIFSVWISRQEQQLVMNREEHY